MTSFEHELGKFNRLQMFDIWNRAKLGEALEGEEKTIGEMMQQHPEYHDTWDRADELADKEYDPETEVNPFLHIAIDSIVVNQINGRTPPEVADAYQRLRARHLSHLEAIHEINRVFVKHLWHVMKEQVPFDRKRYAKDVERL